MSRFSLINFFLPKFLLDGNLTKSLTGREMPRKKGLEEAEIQKLYTTVPEHLMTNSSSVHFVQKTLSGNTPVVGTMIIPRVASVTKDTGSGLLPPSVT